MIHVYKIVAPGSDLDQEPFEIQSASRDDADDRARHRVRTVFSLSGRSKVGVAHVAAYPSRRAQQQAEERAHESGVSLTAGDVDAVLDVCLGAELRKAGAR